jgi:hypothetical protein
MVEFNAKVSKEWALRHPSFPKFRLDSLVALSVSAHLARTMSRALRFCIWEYMESKV